jgi:hypothetical protein
MGYVREIQMHNALRTGFIPSVNPKVNQSVLA